VSLLSFFCRFQPHPLGESDSGIPGRGEAFGAGPLAKGISVLPVLPHRPGRRPRLHPAGKQLDEAKLQRRRPTVATHAQRHWREENEFRRGHDSWNIARTVECRKMVFRALRKPTPNPIGGILELATNSRLHCHGSFAV
jgi:hypothetical protein